ncbi:MAG TPA: DUF1206 domain-containing protein [Luteitalea sp.]|nr:DUF1206 domain-containing protein [Luteitalea sp.]
MIAAPLAAMATLAIPDSTRHVRPWALRLVRLGYAAKGIIYVLIGALALQLAIGDGGRLTDATGVLDYITGLPFGTPLLTMIGIGLLAYAGWEVMHAFVARPPFQDARAPVWRAFMSFKGVVYGALGLKALQLVVGNGGTRSRGPEGYARDAMQLPLGDWLLVLAGIGVAIYGGHQLWIAWKDRIDDDMDRSRLRGEGLGWVLTVGRAGVAARGVVFIVTGLALARAGFDRRPSAASDTGEALQTLLLQPYGTALLALTAAGLVCFGAYQMLHARYARV